jgi:hypothetical protein
MYGYLNVLGGGGVEIKLQPFCVLNWLRREQHLPRPDLHHYTLDKSRVDSTNLCYAMANNLTDRSSSRFFFLFLKLFGE